MEGGRQEEEGELGATPPQSATPVAGGGAGKKGSPCEECGEQPWKYRCPGCGRLTCSLPCVQAHKRAAACTGKRPRTDPVPLARFDDARLLSDYAFLEEAKQAAESAHRLIGGFGRNFGGPGGAQLPKWLFFLRKAAQRRGVRLYFLPRGMARREHNRSRHNVRKDCIYWTVEWRFSSTDVILTDHEIDEHATLLSLLEKHLSPGPWKDQLTQYRKTELRDLKLFIQKSAKESESPYRQLNVEEPLGQQLRGILVVEYPTISVFLPSDNVDFEVEKMVNKLPRDEKPPRSSTDVPHLEGTEFHEEEIEEGEFAPDTQIIDLKDCGASQPTNLAPVQIASESMVDNCIDSLNMSSAGLELCGHQVELNQYSGMALNTASGAPKSESCMDVYPLDMEKTRNAGLTSKMHGIDLKDNGTSHPSNLTGAEGGTASKIEIKADSLVPSSVSILTSDGANGPLLDESKRTPTSTPEALKRKSCAKVYPLDAEDSQGLLFPEEATDLGFEQEMRDTYPELFGDMGTNDFLSYDLEMMDGDDSVDMMSALLWDNLEDGEIPGASSV